MPGALDGVRVISMAEQYPGPYCTMLLADMGADVVLVERPGMGDPARGPGGMSDHFAAISRNKRSITVDAKSAAGRDIILDLAGTADVLVEGFRPGVMARLGLDYPSLRTANPRLVYCSISGYGQDGPYRDRPGHDLTYQALAGMLAERGPDVESDGRVGVAIGDLSSGMFAALGILAALLVQRQTGCGQYLDVSMTDGLVSWMGSSLAALINHPSSWQSPRQREPAYGVFACADGGCITLSIAHEDHFWRNLCAVLDRRDLAELRGPERQARVDELRHWLQQELLLRTREAWVEVLSTAGVPCGPVLDLAEVPHDPQLKARGLFGRLNVEAEGAAYVNHPTRFTDTPAGVHSPPPRLGQHTDAILEELGYTLADMAGLREQHVI